MRGRGPTAAIPGVPRNPEPARRAIAADDWESRTAASTAAARQFWKSSRGQRWTRCVAFLLSLRMGKSPPVFHATCLPALPLRVSTHRDRRPRCIWQHRPLLQPTERQSRRRVAHFRGPSKEQPWFVGDSCPIRAAALNHATAESTCCERADSCGTEYGLIRGALGARALPAGVPGNTTGPERALHRHASAERRQR
jgi:hypothetical protein